jgi:hypothetical protein
MFVGALNGGACHRLFRNVIHDGAPYNGLRQNRLHADDHDQNSNALFNYRHDWGVEINTRVRKACPALPLKSKL